MDTVDGNSLQETPAFAPDAVEDGQVEVVLHHFSNLRTAPELLHKAGNKRRSVWESPTDSFW